MSGHSRPRLALVCCLIANMAMGPSGLWAQQGASDVPTITIRTNSRLVVVDVVVTDKKGQPISGLKADDFVLEEGGKKQKISIFVPPGVANAAATAPPPGVLSNRAENVSGGGVPTVLILDALNSPFVNQAYARSQMLLYAAEQSQGGHTMAILALTDRLHVLQQFTSDPQALITAIKNFKPQEQALRPDATRAESTVPTDVGSHGGAVAASIALAQAEVASFSGLQVAFDQERRTLITIEAMRTLSRMLGGLQGRKNVVWLTAVLPFDLIPENRNVTDAELMAELPGEGRQRSAAINGGGSIQAEQRTLHNQDIREAETQLASANIAIYPVDLHGLVGGAENLSTASFAHNGDEHGAGMANAALAQSSVLTNSQGTMREIAAETGGKAYINQNEVKLGVSMAVADEKASYSLGYYPDNKKWDGKYRSIKIKLVQGDAEIRHRKGYFAIEPGPSKDHNFEQDVAAALMVNAPATQISFRAQAKPTDPGKIRVIFLVDAQTLTAEDSGGSKKMNVAFYAGLYDAKGKSLGIHSMKVDRAFDGPTYQQIVEKGMLVPLDMDVPAGATELRLAVLDNKTGLIGTVTGPIGQ